MFYSMYVKYWSETRGNTDVCTGNSESALEPYDSAACTVKPVYNDHLYNKIYYLWFIQ